MAQPHLAAAPPGRELEPGEGVDRHRVGIDPAHVAEGDLCAAPPEQPANAVAEPGQVGAGDRTVYGKGDRPRRKRGHRDVDRRPCDNSSEAGPMSSRP